MTAYLLFYPVSTQLTVKERQDRETVRVEVFRNGRSRRHCCLYSIDAQFPKLDVAGSIPVSRFKVNYLQVLFSASDSIYSVNALLEELWSDNANHMR